MIDLHTRVRVIDELFKTKMNNETYLMDPTNDAYHLLNCSGSRIFELLECEISVSEICQTLEGEYLASAQIIHRDVLALLEKMRERGLITVNSDSAPVSSDN
jgi:hypothetical protein